MYGFSVKDSSFIIDLCFVSDNFWFEDDKTVDGRQSF